MKDVGASTSVPMRSNRKELQIRQLEGQLNAISSSEIPICGSQEVKSQYLNLDLYHWDAAVETGSLRNLLLVIARNGEASASVAKLQGAPDQMRDTA